MKKMLSISLAICLALSMMLFAACERKTEEDPVSLITASTLTVENGIGGGTFVTDSNVTVTANAPEGEYVFSGWKVGEEIVSQLATYTFKIQSDTTITAVYEYPYSVWDGVYPEEAPATYVIDTTAKTIDLNDAAALAYWRTLLFSNTTGYETKFQLYNVNINCNIDMAGFNWNPIDNENAVLHGVTLDGKGNTIKNMYTVAKAAKQDTSEYRGWGTGGFITMVGGTQIFTIKNLNFKNASVVGTTGQMGVVIGGIYNSTVTLDNVHVFDSIVDSSTGHKTGGLIGRIGNCGDGSGDHEVVTLKDCSVSGTTIIGMRNIGGLVGAQFSSVAEPQNLILLGENTVSNCNFITFASTLNNVGVKYTMNNQVYDNSKSIMYNNNSEIDQTNIIINTRSYVAQAYYQKNNTSGVLTTYSLYPLYPVLAESLYSVFNAYAMETYANADIRYDIRPIFITCDLDLTVLFSDNAAFADVVLADTVVFYTLNGATITGIPESVMGNAKIIAWNSGSPVIIEPAILPVAAVSPY